MKYPSQFRPWQPWSHGVASLLPLLVDHDLQAHPLPRQLRRWADDLVAKLLLSCCYGSIAIALGDEDLFTYFDVNKRVVFE